MSARRFAGFLVRLVLGTMLVLALGFLAFVAGLPDGVADERTATDAIIVLTGGSDRVATGFALFERGLGRQILVSGVGPDTTKAELLGHAGRSSDALACCLTLGHGADDTRGNAREAAAWMRRKGLRSLRLVTAQYHMPRSMLLFRREMPEVDIVAHPVFPGAVKQREWWQWPGTTRLLVNEYVKYLGALGIDSMGMLRERSA